jgi:tetratricopeptide (TPR) repeat protein
MEGTAHIWGRNELLIMFFMEEKLYTEALSLLSKMNRELEPSLLLAKAICLFELHKWIEALEVALSLEKHEWLLPDMLMIRGKSLYKLGEFETAKSIFEKYDAVNPSPETKRWIQRCIVRIEVQTEENINRIIRHEPQSAQPAARQIKHEWYQTRSQLSLLLFAKGVTESGLHVTVASNSVRIIIDTPHRIEFSVDLVKEIVPNEYSISITPMKVEVKMTKVASAYGQWSEIETSVF